MTRAMCLTAAAIFATAAAAAAGGSGALLPETPLAGEHLVAAPLPAELFAAADAAFGNVWVEDDTGARVPTLIEPVTQRAARTVREPCALRRTRAELSDDGTALELDFGLADGAAPPAGLTVQTPLRDFRRRVRVATSADGTTWRTRTEDAVIYGLARFIDVRQCEVRWTPEPDDRHVRITFLDAGAERTDAARQMTVTSEGHATTQTIIRTEPLPVTRIDFWRERTQQVSGETLLAPYPVYARAAGVADGWQVIDLAAGGVPLSRLTLRTGDPLFSRAYTLHGLEPREGGVRETPLAAGTLAQIDFQGVAATNLAVAFAPRRFEVYRLRLAAANGATAAVAVARAEGPAWQAVVPMRPGRRYTLRVGDDPPPDDGGRAAVAALRTAGAATAAGRVEGFTAAPGRAGPRLGKTHLLFLAMLTAGGVLLWTLLRAAKRMR